MPIAQNDSVVSVIGPMSTVDELSVVIFTVLAPTKYW